jgi:hypothetical protein
MGHAVLIEMNQYMKGKIKGKKFIGSGGTRVVYDLGNGYVLKLAKSKKGILCNKMEVKMYKSSLRPINKHLAQIIDYDTAYRWVTMKKYNQKFPPNSPIYRRKLMKLVKKFLDNGIIPSKGVGQYNKPYTPNLRLKRNHQIVVIDYGDFNMALNKNRIPFILRKIIGVGARRVVYDLGNGYVVKVAKSKYGIKSNKREVKTFNSCSTRVKKLLGKITNYDYKYHWVIMKKHTRKFPHLKKYKRKLSQLRRLFRKYGIYPYEVVSRKGKPNYQNLRLKKHGRIVVIDYGNFRFRRI